MSPFAASRAAAVLLRVITVSAVQGPEWPLPSGLGDSVSQFQRSRKNVLTRLQDPLGRSLKILDLCAGNG